MIKADLVTKSTWALKFRSESQITQRFLACWLGVNPRGFSFVASFSLRAFEPVTKISGFKRMWWSTVSKAALRSGRTKLSVYWHLDWTFTITGCKICSNTNITPLYIQVSLKYSSIRNSTKRRNQKPIWRKYSNCNSNANIFKAYYINSFTWTAFLHIHANKPNICDSLFLKLSLFFLLYNRHNLKINEAKIFVFLTETTC